MTEIGHNSDNATAEELGLTEPIPEDDPIPAGGIHENLKRFVDAIEELENQKTDVLVDIKQWYDSAKEAGFDVKVLRKLIAIRRRDKEARDYEESLLETYMHALGMI